MRIEKEVRGPWTIWVGNYCVIGFDRNTHGIEVRNFSGRFEEIKEGSSGDVGAGLGPALDKFLHNSVDDSTVQSIMAVATDYLISAKRLGNIREIEPYHQHDCADCIFLGRSNSLMDLYFCEQMSGPFPSIIARWGSAPAENKSGLLIAMTGHDNDLFEGLQFAVNAGLFLGREHILQRMGTQEMVDTLLQAS